MLSRMGAVLIAAGLVVAGAGPATAQVADAGPEDHRAPASVAPYEASHVAGLFEGVRFAPDGVARGPGPTSGVRQERSPMVPPALQEERRFPQGIALVAAGTALIITGSLIDDGVGTAIVVGGAGLVGLGVYRLMR